MTMADVDVIITAWNSQLWIARCLQSVLAQEGVRYQLLVVDNGSTDQTCDEIRRVAPSATVLQHPTNLGPARARNLAIRQMASRYVLTLDHDVELTPGFLRALLEAAEASDHRVGMWMGKVLRMDRRTLDSTGMILTKSLRAFDRGSGQRDLGQWDHAPEGMLGASACAAFYRRAMLEDLREGDAYFDERFFWLWEDVELAWRGATRGWRSAYVPAAVCYHARNGSGQSDRVRQALSYHNRWLLIRKHRLYRPLHRYLWRAGLYDAARWLVVTLTNPRALDRRALLAALAGSR